MHPLCNCPYLIFFDLIVTHPIEQQPLPQAASLSPPPDSTALVFIGPPPFPADLHSTLLWPLPPTIETHPLIPKSPGRIWVPPWWFPRRPTTFSKTFRLRTFPSASFSKTFRLKTFTFAFAGTILHHVSPALTIVPTASTSYPSG